MLDCLHCGDFLLLEALWKKSTFVKLDDIGFQTDSSRVYFQRETLIFIRMKDDQWINMPRLSLLTVLTTSSSYRASSIALDISYDFVMCDRNHR